MESSEGFLDRSSQDGTLPNLENPPGSFGVPQCRDSACWVTRRQPRQAFANKIWNVGRFIITEYEKNAGSVQIVTWHPIVAPNKKTGCLCEKLLLFFFDEMSLTGWKISVQFPKKVWNSTRLLFFLKTLQVFYRYFRISSILWCMLCFRLGFRVQKTWCFFPVSTLDWLVLKHHRWQPFQVSRGFSLRSDVLTPCDVAWQISQKSPCDPQLTKSISYWMFVLIHAGKCVV